MKPDVRILLVEDNDADTAAIQGCLSVNLEVTFHLHPVKRTEEALEFLKHESCDLVMLDLLLRDEQGTTALAAIHSQAPETPVLVLTDQSDEPNALRALKEGAQDYLLKNDLQGPILWKAIRYTIERHMMGRSMMRAEKLQALGTLAGGIAHDFNNILLAVSGNAKLALETLPKDHPAHANVLEMAKAGSRAVALTKKILSFCGQQETNLQTTQLTPIVEEALSLIQPTLPRDIEVRRNFPGNLPPVLADASQIHEIIVNLISNAIDAIGSDAGLLEVSAAAVHVSGTGSRLSAKLKPGDYIKLSLKDNGRGMDRATLARVFEPFFTTKNQGRGTGMGLAVVHGIMKNHAGEITVYSEIKKGTVLNLYFPVTSETPIEESRAVPSPRGEGEHIVYVDDEEPLVLLVTRALKRLGYRVSGFTDPVEALEALRQTPGEFQAIVTDLSMPRMSGIEFAREALEMNPSLPVILTTGYLHAKDEELAHQVGVRELILKPDTVEDLGDALHRLLTFAKNQKPTTAARAAQS